MEKLIKLYNGQFGRKHLKEKYAKVWKGFWNAIIFAISFVLFMGIIQGLTKLSNLINYVVWG